MSCTSPTDVDLKHGAEHDAGDRRAIDRRCSDAHGRRSEPAPEFQSPTESEASEDIDSAASLLLSAPAPEPVQTEPTLNPQVDLAAAALEATSNIAAPSRTTTPEQDAQQGREWFNRGTQLLEDKKYREALSCFDKSLSCWLMMKRK